MNDGIWRVLPRCLEQVQRADGIDVEVGEGFSRGPVMRGLGGGMDDELNLRARNGSKSDIVAWTIADVDRRGARYALTEEVL